MFIRPLEAKKAGTRAISSDSVKASIQEFLASDYDTAQFICNVHKIDVSSEVFQKFLDVDVIGIGNFYNANLKGKIKIAYKVVSDEKVSDVSYVELVKL